MTSSWDITLLQNSLRLWLHQFKKTHKMSPALKWCQMQLYFSRDLLCHSYKKSGSSFCGREVRWMSEFSKRLCWTFWLWRCSCCKPSFCVRFLGFHLQLELASESWLSRTSVNIFWDLLGVVCNGLTCLFVNVPEQSKWESPVHLWRREDDGSQASPSQMRVLGTNFFKLAF